MVSPLSKAIIAINTGDRGMLNCKDCKGSSQVVEHHKKVWRLRFNKEKR